MAIALICTTCNKRYEVPEKLAGRRIKCKGCGTVMPVPSAAVEEDSTDPFGFDEPNEGPKAVPSEAMLTRGAGRSRSAAEANGGVPGWVWIAGGGAALVVVLLVIAMLATRRSAPPDVAAAGRAVAGEATAEPAGEPAAVAAAPAAVPAAPRVPAAPPDPAFQRGDTAAKKDPAWRVRPDPGPKLEFPKIEKLSIAIPAAYGQNEPLYPTTASPFVIMGGNDADQHYREVWDLRTPARVGRLSGRLEVAKPMALSPDGAYFACHTNPVPRTTDIWRVADATRIGRIADDDNIPDVIDFTGPSTLYIGASYSKRIQFWDFQTGRKLARIETPEGFDHDSLALSPGRQYLALVLSHRNRLHVYKLPEGTPAGMVELPHDGNATLSCEGLAFSPDGTALTGLFAAGFQSHLITVDVATGAVESDFAPQGYQPFGKSFAYEGSPVQWLPDGKGWLMHDQAIVERKSGQIAWTLPFNKEKGFPEGPRKILDADRAVVVAGDGLQRNSLRLVPLPRAKIEAALTAAHEGRSAAEVELPPLKSADRSKAKPVAAPAGPVAWSASPDPGAAGKKTTTRPIGLLAKAIDLVAVFPSNAATAQAIVTSTPGARLKVVQVGRQGQEPRQVERVDLVGGRVLGRFTISAFSLPIALSPDAGRVLLGHSGAADRIDVHTTADGKHVVGWRPYEKEPAEAREVVWADFLDGDRVLTVSKTGTLILWSLPDCKAVYETAQACNGAPKLSPGRKTLAAIRGESLRIIDAATGEVKGVSSGSIANPDGQGLAAAAFRSDGKELAAVSGDSLVRWDLTTGQVVEQGAAPRRAAGKTSVALQYGGPHHLLFDDTMLYDLEAKRAVWYYQGGAHASGGPDGPHWVACASGIIDKASLRPIAMPDPQAVRASSTATDPKAKTLLGEGARVTVQVEGAPPRDADAFRRKVIDGLAAHLQAAGAQMEENQPVRLVARFQEKDLGVPIELHRMGTGEKRTMAARDVIGELTLTDGRGSPIPLAREVIGPRNFSFGTLPAGENDWEGYLRTRDWVNDADRLLAHGLPYYAARRPDGVVVLPGLTDLGYPH